MAAYPPQQPPGYYPGVPPVGVAPMVPTYGAPAAAGGKPAIPLGAWQSGLCNCCDDCFICLLGSCHRPLLYGENARKITGFGFCGSCCLDTWCSCCACLYAAPMRGQLRAKYQLPEDPCGDCIVHCFCHPCATCQESRELRLREGWKTWAD